MWTQKRTSQSCEETHIWTFRGIVLYCAEHPMQRERKWFESGISIEKLQQKTISTAWWKKHGAYIFCAAHCKKTPDLIIPGGPLSGEIMKHVQFISFRWCRFIKFFYLQAIPTFRPNKMGDPFGFNSATIELKVDGNEKRGGLGKTQ